MPKSIRAFVAVHLPDDVCGYLDAISQSYADKLPTGSVRWVKPEAMHLTVRFLGDTAVERIAEIAAVLDEVAGKRAPFELWLERLGCFPNERRPRVIWAGLAGAIDQAAALKRDVDRALKPLGWDPEDKRFKPHLTLGRVKHSYQQIQLPWNERLDRRAVPVVALHLIESKLTASGPIYTVRHTALLREQAS